MVVFDFVQNRHLFLSLKFLDQDNFVKILYTDDQKNCNTVSHLLSKAEAYHNVGVVYSAICQY